MKKLRTLGFTLLLAASFSLSVFTAQAETLPIKKLNFGRVTELFQKDILKYYKVDKKMYDSPLKEKKYLESSDYKTLKERFNEEYANTLHNQYVLSTKIKSQYNMNTSTFSIELPHEFRKKLVLQTNDPHFKGKHFTTPQIDEDTAYSIEMGESSFEVVVRLTGELDTKHHNALYCVPVKVLIRNKAGQILYEYDIPATTITSNK